MTDHELTEFPRARTAHRINRSLCSRGRFAPREKESTHLGELDQSRRAVEQSDTQLALEALHLLTQGSLSQVLTLCSMAEVPLLCDCNEVLQLTKLH